VVVPMRGHSCCSLYYFIFHDDINSVLILQLSLTAGGMPTMEHASRGSGNHADSNAFLNDPLVGRALKILALGRVEVWQMESRAPLVGAGIVFLNSALRNDLT
jgi:hypothetical protein